MERMAERLMYRMKLFLEYSAEQMAYCCQRYGSSREACCPKGIFVCPFSFKDESGKWIAKVSCRNVTAEDWSRVLEGASCQKEERNE